MVAVEVMVHSTRCHVSLRSTKRRETMEGKEELLKLAHKQLDQAAKLLNAAGEELLAEEADALAVKVSLAEAALHPLLP
jgi:hypothetical protein